MSPKALNPQSICLATVTYFPEESFFSRFPNLSSRFGGSVIVDNRSPDETTRRFKDLGSKTDFILNQSNFGLAYALNQAIQKVIQRSFSWVLLVDQDSDLDEGFLQAYEAALDAFDSPNRVAVIGNNYSYAVGSDQVPLFPKKAQSTPFIECDAVITAGSLISLQAFSDIGPFREDFFIDWIDTEFCHRARRRGYKILMVTRPVVRQTIGRTVEMDSIVGTIRTTNHASLRRYYMTRNLILLFKENAFFEPGWFVARFYDLLKTIVKILLFEQEKKSKLSGMLQGIIDGIFKS